MGVITISREYGSDGRAVGQKAAQALDYLYMDKDLIVEVAREAQVPVSEVERFDEQPEHPALRVLRKFLTPGYADTLTGLSEYEWWATATIPELSSQRDQALSTLDEEVFVRLTQEVMRRLADQGKVVLLGRGSQVLLADRSDTLHVRVVAPMEYRTKVIVEQDELDRVAASKRIRKVDEQRKRYIKRHYGVAWDDPKLYHLTVNAGQTGVEVAAQTVIEAARRLPMG